MKKQTGKSVTVTVTQIASEPSTDLRSVAGRMAESARASVRTGAEATHKVAAKAGAGLSRAGEGIGKAAGSTARAAGKLGGAAVHAVGDLNGDGKIDEADFRIARDAAARLATAAAREAAELGKAVARHEITKDAAAGAAVGALIAVPIPIVGPVTGAAVGAAIGLTRGVVDAGVIGNVVGQIAEGVRSPPRRKTTRRKKSPSKA